MCLSDVIVEIETVCRKRDPQLSHSSYNCFFFFSIESGHPKGLLGRKFLQNELKIVPTRGSDL